MAIICLHLTSYFYIISGVEVMDRKMTSITRSDDWQQIDARHHLAPFTDYASLRKNGARVITLSLIHISEPTRPY